MLTNGERIHRVWVIIKWGQGENRPWTISLSLDEGQEVNINISTFIYCDIIYRFFDFSTVLTQWNGTEIWAEVITEGFK